MVLWKVTICQIGTNVLKQHAASNFRDFNLDMEEVHSSEELVSFYQTT